MKTFNPKPLGVVIAALTLGAAVSSVNAQENEAAGNVQVEEIVVPNPWLILLMPNVMLIPSSRLFPQRISVAFPMYLSRMH